MVVLYRFGPEGKMGQQGGPHGEEEEGGLAGLGQGERKERGEQLGCCGLPAV
jgi:hypothetical protein